MAAAGTETSLAAAREAGIKPGDGYGLTVIIPTKDRPLLLRQTVKTVLAQSVLPLQVVIIDQSREPAARAPLAASATRHPSVELVYLHAPEIPSAAAARNRAMSVARGTIWLFLDDDVILEPGFTAALVASYRQQPRAAGISGVITNYAPPKRLVRCWQGAFYRGPFADDRQPVYWHAHLAGAQPLLIPVSRLGAGLMSFWASSIGQVRFDTRLVGSSTGEDVDFCLRLGGPQRFFIATGARLRHLRSPQRERQPALREAGLAAWYLHLEHPHCHRHQALLFAWLNGGLLLAAAGACLRHRSLKPLGWLGSGIVAAWAVHRRREPPVSAA